MQDVHFAVHILPRIPYLGSVIIHWRSVMVHVIVRHKVADYGRWKEAFDGHLAARKAAGEVGYRVMLSVDDPHEVTIFLDWDSLDRARKFAASDGLKQKMQQSGVIGDPDVRFLEDAYAVRRSSAD
jgi:heme-degrading monooxygenase HmoA